ncbi:MAG: MYXO-CTERM sorting domain-containing protein [Polyangiales bacterium]
MLRKAIPLAILLVSAQAEAATYQVGPTRTYKSPSAVAGMLKPGDVVEIDGGSTYTSVLFDQNGTAGSKITIRGIKTGGKRPVISGGNNAIEAAGSHYVFEGLEITNGASRCFYHHADDVTLRDSVIHDCPKQGILGADNDSGSLLLEYSEVYKCGQGTQNHQIYMATDESVHPGSVFRMQFCYVHDANGGNNVKSRAERNEIYYNWIEGALYHELELIGPDPAGGIAEGLKREDSDVVGNVLKKGVDFSFVRTGGDGTGQSNGRYRFVNNTFIGFGTGSTAFRIFDGIDSIEMHDNVFWRSGGSFNITRTVEAVWVSGEQIAGQNNWIVTGSPAVPTEWTGTITGTDPGFTNPGSNDFTPKTGSALIDKGTTTTSGPAGHAFPSPLAMPLYHPPKRALIAVGSAEPRPVVGAIDIGAFEFGTGPAPDAGPMVDGSVPPDASPTDGAASDTSVSPTDDAAIDDAAESDGATPASDDAGGTNAAATDDSGGCGCRVPSRSSTGGGAIVALLVASVALRRRKR